MRIGHDSPENHCQTMHPTLVDSIYPGEESDTETEAETGSEEICFV